MPETCHFLHSKWSQKKSLKAGIRTEALTYRKKMTDKDVQSLSKEICQKILSQLSAPPINIHLFLPMKKNHEVDLQSLLPALWERHDKVYVPRVTSNQTLEHVRLLPETLIKENRWGIPEPTLDSLPASKEEVQEIQIALTPLLICDKEGFRVGYGGGFYDQFFQDHPHITKIGVGFFEPITKILDTYEGDIPLDQYISPRTITRFHS